MACSNAPISPDSYSAQASAVMPAVSRRRIRLPSPADTAPASSAARHSSSVKPPSGPTTSGRLASSAEFDSACSTKGFSTSLSWEPCSFHNKIYGIIAGKQRKQIFPRQRLFNRRYPVTMRLFSRLFCNLAPALQPLPFLLGIVLNNRSVR